MANLNIVLVEPEIPQNTGNIARTCACTGARLHIVKPMGFTVTDRHLKRSGLDYWEFLDITYYESLGEFLKKHGDAPLFFFTTKAVRRHSDIEYPDGAFLVFGKETAGLPEELLLKHPDTSVRIPMMDDRRSLNLSNSVAVGVYEVLRQWEYPELQCSGELHRYRWTDANDL